MNETDACRAVVIEMERARVMYPSFNSKHEGYAIIKEELDELWEEIKRKPRDEDAIVGEAIQVAAMTLRFLVDCCNGEKHE